VGNEVHGTIPHAKVRPARVETPKAVRVTGTLRILRSGEVSWPGAGGETGVVGAAGIRGRGSQMEAIGRPDGRCAHRRVKTTIKIVPPIKLVRRHRRTFADHQRI